ncbi:MAG: CRTAC1 family protein [Candidatus Latescibacterota bacterium]|nr:CRTAC1 family protein [Candidatus Latescibacterota bacterium]
MALLLVCSIARADPLFVDATERAGLAHKTVNGGPHKRFILESTGSGAAFFDYDDDGDLDLYVVDGSTYAAYGAGPGNVLYRNEGQGVFAAVVAGVEDRSWGVGVAVGDVDGDGHRDLYATNYGANALYRNRGDGTFAVAEAGVGGDDFSASAAFFDYDNDGDLDLYVANYVVFDIEPLLDDPELDDPCIYLGGLRVFGGPQGMEGGRDRLYRNDGGGTFADATLALGVASANAYYGLGVVPEDFDGDGDLDLFVANDETPNVLFRNEGGAFVDVAVEAGVAYNGDGETEAGMGVDAGDADGDGDVDLYVTNFYGETNTFYKNLGDGTFADATAESGLAAPTVSYLGWGARFFDCDNDGDLDLFAANGHVYPQVDEAAAGGRYDQRNQLFANAGDGTYGAVVGGSGLAVEKSSRGAISGDYDNDGDVDLLITNIDDHPTLLRNDYASGYWLAVRLEGQGANRAALGARVRLMADGRAQVRRVNGAASYLGHSDTRLYFGLGDAGYVDRVEIVWPDGTVEHMENLPANSLLVARQGRGYEVRDLVPGLE